MRTRIASWSDSTFRRVAWAVWMFQVVVLVLSVGLATVAPESANNSSWGSSSFLSDLIFSVVVFSFPCVGLLIVLRQPPNRIGWLLLAGIGLADGVSRAFDCYAVYALAISPGSLPGGAVASSLIEGSWTWVIGGIAIFLILLFPDGRLPSPRWRWLPRVALTSIVMLSTAISLGSKELVESPIPELANPLFVPALEVPMFVVLAVTLPLFPICVIASAVALIRRFRRSHGTERLQLKWLAEAGVAVAAVYFVAMAGQLFAPAKVSSSAPNPGWLNLLQNLTVPAFGLLPLAIGVAILRHKLYDIDRVINRTVVYGLLTLLLAGTYLMLVLSLRVLLDPLTRESDLAVAASTLAVAALFRPARRRIQRVVDRRFFRNKYDAARTVESFAGRLRQEVDLDSVSSDLRVVVRDTVEPAHVSLWLRGAAPTRGQP